MLPGVDLSVKMCMESLDNIRAMTKEIVNEWGIVKRSRLVMPNRMDQFAKRLSKEVAVFTGSVASLRTFSQE